MSEKKLIDATALCQYLSNWQLSCAGNVTGGEGAEAAIRELHARGPEIERLYLDSKILPGELRALVMVSNCLEREFVHRQLATGQPLHMNIL